jgi:hypothetical protein
MEKLTFNAITSGHGVEQQQISKRWVVDNTNSESPNSPHVPLSEKVSHVVSSRLLTFQLSHIFNFSWLHTFRQSDSN